MTSTVLFCNSLFLGDFNAHISLWGSPDTNPRGQIIEDFITNNCLCILNNGDNTYFCEPSRIFHAIDLIISSPILFPYFNFSVSNKLHRVTIFLYSCHFTILITSTIITLDIYTGWPANLEFLETWKSQGILRHL